MADAIHILRFYDFVSQVIGICPKRGKLYAKAPGPSFHLPGEPTEMRFYDLRRKQNTIRTSSNEADAEALADSATQKGEELKGRFVCRLPFIIFTENGIRLGKL